MGEGRGRGHGARKGLTLLRALFYTLKWRIALCGACLVGKSAAHITQAMLVGRLIAYFDDEHAAGWEGWALASSVVGTGAVYR